MARRRRRSQAAKLERQYQYRSRLTEEILQGERYREKQSEYMKVVKQKQKEVVETTVFITRVLDMKVESNRLNLREFLARTYGPVAFCRPHHYKNRRRNPYPPALVRFERASDASKLFGGESLLRVDKSVRIKCPVGQNGGCVMVSMRRLPNFERCLYHSLTFLRVPFIQVHRFGHVDEIVLEELTGSLIPFSTRGLSFGHWYPPQEGALTDDDKGEWLGVETAAELTVEHDPDFGDMAGALWLMDVWSSRSGAPVAPAVEINLAKRLVTMTFQGEFSKEAMSFRFKQLRSPMSLCKDEDGSLSIVFSLKYPPKIEKEVLMRDMNTGAYRRNSWAGVRTEVLGNCLGYKIAVMEEQVAALLQHEKYPQLKNFGVLEMDESQDIISHWIDWSAETDWNKIIVSMKHVRLRK